MAASNTYQAIATSTLGSTASSISFSSISSAYTDLILVCYIIPASSGASPSINVGASNSLDTGTNYSNTSITEGGSPVSFRRTNYANGDSGISQTGFNSGVPATSIWHIQNYANTTTYKTLLARTGNPQEVAASVVLWRNTAAINIVQISQGGSGMSAGSQATLYGIAAA